MLSLEMPDTERTEELYKRIKKLEKEQEITKNILSDNVKTLKRVQSKIKEMEAQAEKFLRYMNMLSMLIYGVAPSAAVSAVAPTFMGLPSMAIFKGEAIRAQAVATLGAPVAGIAPVGGVATLAVLVPLIIQIVTTVAQVYDNWWAEKLRREMAIERIAMHKELYDEVLASLTLQEKDRREAYRSVVPA